MLGNWVGGAAAGTTGPPDGRLAQGDLDWQGFDPPRGVEHAPSYITPDSTTDTFKWLQTVNPRNEIGQLDLDRDGPTYQIQTQYDAAGNLIYDGTYYYQYDAWNRLVQINEASWNTGTSSVDIGLIVKHYTYDGHGRLIRIQSPYPDPWATQGGDFRTERIYYDGIRRIQEVIVDPVTGESGGGEEAEGEDGQIGGGQAVEYLSREYVWGPGDQGFDELLVQYNGLGDEFWAIMDAGGDLVALCDLGGSGGAARVVGQWTYDAYGAVLSADHLHAMAHPHLGHKGLFVDRLDAGIVTDIGGPESPRLVPFAHAVYQNRNRAYSPALGRFFQRDPNATAMALLGSSSTGSGFRALALAFSMEDLYGDGANLYEYLGSNPWSRSDPLGLSWDPFSIVDDYMMESAANRAAYMQKIGRDFEAASIVAATVISLLPIPIVTSVGEFALYALGQQSLGEAVMWAAIGLVPGGKYVGLGVRWAGRLVGFGRKVDRAAGNAHLVGRVMQIGRRTVTVTEEMAKHVGEILPYSQAKELTKGFNHAIEAHHLIPSRYMHLVRVTDDTVPAVVLLWEDHH